MAKTTRSGNNFEKKAIEQYAHKGKQRANRPLTELIMAHTYWENR